MRYKIILGFLPLLVILFSTFGFGQIPTGYYDAAYGKTGDSLRKALSIITSTGHVKLSYSSIWNFYAQTDIRTGTTDKIWDMYSDIPGGIPAYIYTFSVNQCGTSGAEGSCYSREHCFPNSWWGGFDDNGHMQYTDLHHLFPADQYVNLYKSNNPIGTVSNPTKTFTNSSKYGPCSTSGYTGNVYEPIDAYKGDFARAWFYIATRYRDSLGAWVKNYKKPEAIACIDSNTNNFKPWFRDMLMLWHNNDPVSTKEINRNNVIYNNTVQKNRNPFIDHPEYINYIWGSQSIVTKLEPSNYPSNFQAITTYPHNSTITVSWTDAGGTVTPDGYLIKAQAGGYNNITNPIDGIPELNSSLIKNVTQGTQTATFSGLKPETLYYFKIFPYTNADTNINYKNTGNIPLCYDTTFAWKEDFETGSKTSYAVGNVNCSMGNWTLNDALLGNTIYDKFNGSKGIRAGAFTISMNFNKTGGAGTFSVYQSKYSNDVATYWKLLKSTDNGLNWVLVKDSIYNSSQIFAPITIPVNEPNDVRFMMMTYNGTQTKRSNFDDIVITNYIPPVTYKKLKIKCYLEGLFNGSNMNPVQDEFGNKFGPNIADEIRIELRDSTTTYPIIFSKNNVLLKVDGFAFIDSIPSNLNGKYYLVIKHRNHIQTWSSSPIYLNSADTNIYDFTNSNTKAFGNNLKTVQSNTQIINLTNKKNPEFNNISELKSLEYSPERFTIKISPTLNNKIFEVLIIDHLTKKKYVKTVNENLLFNNNKKPDK